MIRTDKATEHTHIWLPYVHRHITVSKGTKPFLSFLGDYYCKYKSGPSLFVLTEEAALFGGSGYYGLLSSEYVGFWADCANNY